MKRLSLFIIVLVLLVAAFPALAQDNPDLITLNDATPAIDVVITLPPDATGTISLDIALAAVRLTDANDAVVFYAADERLRSLEFNITPNSGTHTLTIERLPGVAEAHVTVNSLPEMTINGSVELVAGNTLTFNQEVALSLNADAPGGTVTVNIPTETIGVVTATFPGAYATTQLVDSNGVVMSESMGGHVDGLTFVLDAGDYDFTVLGNGLTDTVVAGVRAVSVDEGGFTIIEAPAPTGVEAVLSGTPSDCTATVTTSSVNLRSGPGTGYSVLGYGYRGELFSVGGWNPENNWIVVGTDGGTAWMAIDTAQMEGTCDGLTVFNVPLQDAAPAQISITSPGSSGDHDDSEADEAHEDHEREESEHDD